jgi:hypothetical protein
MATIFKTLTANDIAETRTYIHEAIPITGALFSGSYDDDTLAIQPNIRNFDMYQSVYDYPYLSSSANHLMDITMGYSTDYAFAWSSSSYEYDKKTQVYDQMSQILVGYDATGSIKSFNIADTYYEAAMFFNFSRLLYKDEIKKGSFRLEHEGTQLVDLESTGSYFTNSPAGDYGILYEEGDTSATPFGLLYYQAGIAVLTDDVRAFVSGSGLSITGSATVWRDANENQTVQFSNTTELNSTIYFCRLNQNEFNMSSNPTYTSGSEILVKDGQHKTPPHAYVSTVGLYGADNSLLGVAKLSTPLKKSSENSLTIRCRADY